jgi:hypothetical protein
VETLVITTVEWFVLILEMIKEMKMYSSSPYMVVKHIVLWGGQNKEYQASTILAAWRSDCISKANVLELERELGFKILPDIYRNKETESYYVERVSNGKGL